VNKDPLEASRILTPSELAQAKARRLRAATASISPAANPGTNAVLSPSQLGYSGGFSGLFGGNKAETAPFKGEPTRESLTQPPPGYQTPSPELCLRHRAEGIAQQGIQPGRRQVWRIVKPISRLREACRLSRGVYRDWLPDRFFGPSFSMEMARIVAATSVTRFRGTRARQDMMSSHRFAVVVFAVLLSTFTSASSVLAQTTVTSERPPASR